MNISIINAYGLSNRGDAVLINECLKEVKNKYDKSTLSIYFYDDYKVNNHEPFIGINKYTRIIHSSKKSSITRNLEKANDLLIALLYKHLKLNVILKLVTKEKADAIRNLVGSSLVISAPGGYIHDTNLAYLIALFNIYIPDINSKIICAPQSFGPINSKAGRFISKLVLNRCDIICVRESFSYDFLLELGVKKEKIVLTGDSAFWNSRDRSIKHNFLTENNLASNKFIGITVVDWSFPNSSDPIKSRNDYIEYMSKLIQFIHSKTLMKVVIFNQVSDDLNMAHSISRTLSHPDYLVIDEVEKSPDQLRYLISNSYLFIGTRFHSCIFSLMESIPTFAVSYLPKTKYILKDLDLNDYSTDIDNLDLPHSIKILSDFIDKNPETRLSIKLKIEKYKETHLGLSDVL